ncbi:type II toxin-antitoxin system Phd/YefM family antitoxin [Thermaerobacter sp. PB12/4term]|uniref:type II toxin-antitoxin system Phd/YefM family antitoxin n=1 Tax=Thermaerobacter sp. PB12/4term TaxID=2293838 RepID=UPI0011C0782E|nr:type II toxin-antitoxin system Phd/YefM family antitoxin [Thermaerobacter sp. PB12/4term]QIA26716.1 type II toxin-antitoxin system Phd/YefM family antitoxin [Thermaerobacter sp. PB12/4term]
MTRPRDNLKFEPEINLEVNPMFKLMTVEEARRELGRLLEEVRRTGEPVLLTCRGTGEAVLLSAEEFQRLKNIEEAYARLAFERALDAIGNAVAAARLSPDVIEEAVRAARDGRDAR